MNRPSQSVKNGYFRLLGWLCDHPHFDPRHGMDKEYLISVLEFVHAEGRRVGAREAFREHEKELQELRRAKTYAGFV